MKTAQKSPSRSRPKPPRRGADWSPERYAAFAVDVDALLLDVKERLGEDDVAHAREVQRLSRRFEIVGRTLIHLSLEPASWLAGVLALAAHHQLEAAEIGHSALHGVWDSFPELPELHSADHRWRIPVDEESWKREHNVLHHQYTNVAGRDPDLSYGGLRFTAYPAWRPRHLVQIAQPFFTAPYFAWAIAAHATGLTDLAHPAGDPGYASVLPDRRPATVARAFYRTARKMASYSLYEFVLWPVLAGPFWWKVLSANVAADVLRNLYSWATIYAGHFGDLAYYPPEFRPHGRGAWYKAQIEAAHDYEVPAAISLLCGALDHQIEHHLSPRLPPNRLREIAPRLCEICERHGVRYQRASWPANLGAAMQRLVRYSTPT